MSSYKICNFDCIYCQLGRTKEKINERKEYASPDDILGELKSWLQNNPTEAKNIDYITISGFGEPTLNIKIGQLISMIKKISSAPVAVITNASLMNKIEVRAALLEADLIIPTLDAATSVIFNKINRPHKDIVIEDVVNGLVSLREEFRGKIWLEVMLVRGVNDGLAQIRKLKEVIDKINPDRIHLNSPVRLTAEENVLSVDRSKLEKIRQILGDKAQIV
jgi:wyosine [tRNA(Phe)-imidazoG37] synthetase (radical SAM superfamily)